MIRVEKISSRRRLEEIREEWISLLEHSSANDLFLHPDWIFAWLDAFGEQYGLFFVALWDETRLVGLFPFCIDRTGLFRNLIFAGRPVSDRMDFILKRGMEAECVEVFVSWLLGRTDWDRFYLENFGTFSDHASLLNRSFMRHGVNVDHGPSDYYYYIPVKSFDTMEEYLEGNWSKRSFKRVQKKFSRLGEVEWKLWDRVPEELLNAIVELDTRKSVRGELGQSFFGKEENIRFIKKVIENFRGRGIFHLMSLSNSDGLVSFQIFFSYGRGILLYQTAYDKRLKKYGPGKAVIFETVRYAFETGFEEVDFLLGREDYKKEWTSLYRQSFYAQVFRKGFRGRLLKGYGRLKARLKSSKAFQRRIEGKPLRKVSSPGFRKLQTMEELFSYKEEWKRLLKHSGSNDFFLQPEWISTWWNVYGEGYTPLIVTSWTRKRLDALFLLCATKKNLFRILSFAGEPVSDRMDFVIRKTKEEKYLLSFFDWIERHESWDMMVLENICQRTNTLSLIKKVCDLKGLKAIETYQDACYFINLKNYTDFEEYFRITFNRKHRNYFRRLKKKAMGLQDAECEIVDHFGSALLQEMSILDSQRSFRGERHQCFFRDPIKKHFLELLLEDEFFRKVMRVLTFRSRAGLHAYLVFFVHENKFLAYQTAFDKELRELSIGTQLFLESIRYAFKENLDEYDFLRGDEVFKKRFTKEFRQTKTLMIFPRTVKGRMLYLFYRFFRPTAKKMYNLVKPRSGKA